ncbi:formate C-acetyltransferase [Thermoanaerobacterium thermosaccharolyticum]|uniref:Formate acetyltransferase n=1 Tax=Thermoanaerobacterium thermosaccharolyticum M0795 TaxID=698948 RepID=L0IHV9_THETR|nr:formate C-acetyltransferase [Thermoanaerobacterium thermosaccharolyticum]AGB17806.1 formate acetyltransferase 1 [Thermoanaerobacterium thermosaccharolyticum M0795]
MSNEWRGFQEGKWQKTIDVQDFIQKNYTLYEGDDSFLEGPTEKTTILWNKVLELMKEELKKGVLDIDTKTVSSITSHEAGYIDKDLEEIVGLQTDKPLKRAIMPYGGIRMVKKACEAYGYKVDPAVEEIFTKYRKTHNDGVFDAYTPEIRAARHAGIITGLPDAYGRGRIIGDYRRVALYGIDRLIEEKEKEKLELDYDEFDEATIRLREELTEQIKALNEMKEMALKYGYDISKPAKNAKEAIQWTYFAFLAAIKEQNGAAMSFGRVSTFLDIYIERDLKEGTLTERQAQELMDHFVMKLRMVRFLRTPDYNELFSGDPVWVTESIGGAGVDGRPLVTKNSFRILNTLYNLGPAPEPNLTVLWSKRLPENFKKFCAKVSIDTSSIQYENDDLMRPIYNDDYSIACCVSAMKTGEQMQFFGARANLAKALLYAINGGIDERYKTQVAPKFNPITSEYLNFDEVMAAYDNMLEWLAKVYVKAMNIIHYMHDKYAYERSLMALHDRDIVRTMAFGIAGLSVAADSLSAIKYAKVKAIRDENGIAVDYEVEGDFPKFGNDDDRVDSIAADIVERFMNKLKKHKTYRNSIPTLSVLTITSNVVYGKKTGATPDGRKAGEPFAPGANPMHGRDTKGAVASMNSVSKIPYDSSLDGISYTFTIVPNALGKEDEDKINNLVGLLDGYAFKSGHHINVNVLNRDMLIDAMDHPEKYPQLTIRVSGYAVNFNKLTKEQQLEVISRTFHESM